MRQEHLSVSIATTDYVHFRDFQLGTVAAVSTRHVVSRRSPRDLRTLYPRSRFGCRRALEREALRAGHPRGHWHHLAPWSARGILASARSTATETAVPAPRPISGLEGQIPEWSHLPAIYMRGWLQDEVGIALSEIEWFQEARMQQTRVEKVELDLPASVKLTRVPHRSLSQVLAQATASAPSSPARVLLEGYLDVARLFSNYQETELATTGAPGSGRERALLRCAASPPVENPWLAHNVEGPFSKSKRRSRSHSSTPRYPTFRCRGCRRTRKGCSAASTSLMESKRTGRPGSSRCDTRTSKDTSKESHTG